MLDLVNDWLRLVVIESLFFEDVVKLLRRSGRADDEFSEDAVESGLDVQKKECLWGMC
jgi:hypothetical protein